MRISADGIEETDTLEELKSDSNSKHTTIIPTTMAYNHNNDKNNGLSSSGVQSTNATTNNNNTSSNNAELCNGERVKVIYRYSTPSQSQFSHKTDGFVPLTVIPIVDDKFHDGYYSNWDEVKNQVLNLNFNESTTKAPQNVSFIGKIGSEKDSTVLPLVTKDDYFTALKVAELCGEPLDVMIKENNESKSANAVQSDSGAIPKLRPKRPENCSSDTAPSTSESENEMLYVDRDGNISDKRKCPFSGNCRESAFKPYGTIQQQNRTVLNDGQIDRLKKEITIDVTKKIIMKLNECLTELEIGDNNLDMAGKTVGHNDTETATKNNLNQTSNNNNNKTPPVIHKGIICDHCDSRCIEGIRYKCSVCLDYDLCEKCEALGGVHNDDHSFIKIKQPVKRFALPKKDEDIYLSLDVDLPTGKINFGDVKVVSKPIPSTPTLVSNGSNANQMSSSYLTAGIKSAINASSKSKNTEKKSMKKKFEKIKIRNQMAGSNLFQQSAATVPEDLFRSGRQDLKAPNYQSQLQYNANNALFLSGIFVSDETIPEGTKMPPSTKFRKTWKVRNTGSKAWTGRTTLRYVWGHSELEPYGKINEIQAPPLKPGEEGRITIRFTAPKSPAIALYQSHWRLHHRAQPFGQRLICRIVVDPSCTGVTQPNSSRLQPVKDQVNKTKSDTHKLQRAKHLQEVFTAVKAIRFSLNENEHIPMKTNVKSHTTTPANTPFDISPPKSPEPHSISNSIDHIQENEVILDDDKDKAVILDVAEDFDEEKHNEMMDEVEEAISILSLSSSESGDEFVVVPLPRCFDLNVPFSGTDGSQDVHVLNDIDIILSEEFTHPLSLLREIDIIEETISQNNVKMAPNDATVDKNNAMSNESTRVTNASDNIMEPQPQNIADFLLPVNRNISAAENEPMIPKENNGNVANENEGKPKQTVKVSHQSTNPFRDNETENVIHVLPESIVTGALSAAAHVYNNVSRALFPRNECNNDSRHFAWITSPPPAAIPLPERYWDAQPSNRGEPPHQYQPREFFSTTCASTNSTLTTTSNNAGNFTTKSAKSPTAATAAKPPVESSEPNLLKTALSQLYEMGFWNQSLNEELLQKNSYDVNDTIEDLLSPERGRERRLQARQRSDAPNTEQVVSRQPSHVTPNGFIDEFD